MQRDIDFLIVGTPRSGTTLVQKLVCELEGVKVPPETHFFSKFLPALLNRRSFPLEGADLVDEIRQFSALPSSRALEIDAAGISEVLNNRCDTALELFSAMVRHLAGNAEIYGEKTTEHLLWVKVLSDQSQRLKTIAVVRDPRDVVASSLSVKAWNQKSHVKLAAWWRSDQKELIEAAKLLPAKRLLILRYEDVVADSQGARERLAQFLENHPGSSERSIESGSGELYQPWEYWKTRVNEPITPERIGTYKEKLSTSHAESVLRICKAEMTHFGYPVTVSGSPGVLTRLEAEAWIGARKWLMSRSPECIRTRRNWEKAGQGH